MYRDDNERGRRGRGAMKGGSRARRHLEVLRQGDNERGRRGAGEGQERIREELLGSP
jgi:hypothetical protein